MFTKAEFKEFSQSWNEAISAFSAGTVRAAMPSSEPSWSGVRRDFGVGVSVPLGPAE